MTTIRQLIQTSPTRANELFAKLVDTSENAVKTRERLLAELKEELELLTELEEMHLFPVLRKHKQTKDLVADAVNDNKKMRKLLAELDHTPPDSEEFTDRVAELRTVFQQHVRDEKKELLPAVLKALSDEETRAIVESIEDRKAEIEEEKRAEAEERRELMREERERAEAVQQAAETVVTTLWTGPRATRWAAINAESASTAGLSAVSEIVQRTSDQAVEVFNRTSVQAQDLARQSAQNLSLMTEASRIASRSLQNLSQEWFALASEQAQSNIDALHAVARCRSLPELTATYNELVRARLQQSVDAARRMTSVSARLADEATQSLAVQVADGMKRQAA